MQTTLFQTLGLLPSIQRALDEHNIIEMTPIQALSYEHLKANKDVLAQAPTGTGKTFAFSIPMLENLNLASEDLQVLILTPTRELALQILTELQKLTTYMSGVRMMSIYGGQSMEQQILTLKKRPHIVVGTPGRVMDHLRRHTLKLEKLTTLILDEADEMLRMGFREDIDIILQTVPSERQTVLFSATIPDPIREITHLYQRNPVHVKADVKQTTLPLITQYAVETRDDEKEDVLCRFVDVKHYNLVLVFCRTKRRVDELYESLVGRGYAAEALHGDRSQAQRDRVMRMFRSGQLNILVATDVAARGLDIDDIDAVFNYDVVEDDEFYVHRIGRTGRAGKVGEAYSFLTRRQMSLITLYERLTAGKMQRITAPSLKEVQEARRMSTVNKVTGLLADANHARAKEEILTSLALINENRESPVSALDLAAAFYLQLQPKVKESSKDLIGSRSHEEGEERPSRQRINDGSYKRLFVNLGDKDGFQKRQFITFLCKETGMEKNHLNDVYMLDSFSFIEVHESIAADVQAKLNSLVYKGRPIFAEEAAKKEGGKPARSGFRGPRNDEQRSSRNDEQRSSSRGEERRPYRGDESKSRSTGGYRSDSFRPKYDDAKKPRETRSPYGRRPKTND